MAVLTEGRHTGEFILTEANGQRSREAATVVSGQDLDVGEVVQVDGDGKLTAFVDVQNSDGSQVDEAAGIVIYAADASAADVTGIAYIARDAEVNDNLLKFPTETTTGGEKALTIVSLALLGIIVRA